jgi:hypothetical protein
MKLLHKQVNIGRIEGVLPHMMTHFTETFYTFRYRVGPSGERASILTDFSGSSGEEISL